MSLVAYGSSDDSDDEDFSKTNNFIENKANRISPENKTVAVDEVKISDDEDEIESEPFKTSYSNENCKSLSSLPPPKTELPNIDFDWCRLRKSSKGSVQPVKISIPSLAELEPEESEEPVKKKLKPSEKGSGLFALLPSPKNSFINQTRTTLKPNPTLNKKPISQTLKKLKAVNNLNSSTTVSNNLPSINYEDSGDEDEGHEPDNKKIDFFSLSSSVEVPAADIQIPDIDSMLNINKKKENAQIQEPSQVHNTWQNNLSVRKPIEETSLCINNATASDFVSYPTASSNSFIPLDQEDIQLDETALQQLCGRRERQKAGSGLEIIDVSGDAIMPDAREWLTKQLTEEQNTNIQSHKKKDGPTTQQRRKHQITYLAFQAKEHELELKNQWANNRMSRKQTQAKYGF